MVVGPATASHPVEILLVTVTRDDGQSFSFNNASGNGSTWLSDADVVGRLTAVRDSQQALTGYLYADETDSVETYNLLGQLISVQTRAGLTQSVAYDGNGKLANIQDEFGHALGVTYDAAGRPATVTDPDNRVTTYTYDSVGNLKLVTYPDGSVRTYLYNEPAYTSGTNLPHALTGILDEQAQRYATYRYDALGRGVSTQHGNGANLTTVAYNSDGTRTVTDAAGASRTYSFQTLQSVGHISSVTGAPCSGCGLRASYTYFPDGNLRATTDFRGIGTSYNYTSDGRNLETSKADATGTTITRITSIAWHSSFRTPTQITEGNRRTTFTHDGNGNVLTRTVTDLAAAVSRTWTYTHDSYGRLLTEDGPRTDVSDLSTYTYHRCTGGYQCGQLETITNAAGQVTTFDSYNAHAQPLTITDPNGVVTTLTYDARQRLTSRTIGSESTNFEYWPTGFLKKVTQPDASFVFYSYDNAHRLYKIEDGLGNRIQYTLDAMGNHTAENVYDPSGLLTRTRGQVFNTLNQLWKQLGAAGTTAVTTTFGYDNNGNQTTTNAPLSRNSINAYDELNRLKQITDPGNGITKFGYDANDNLTSVTDPQSRYVLRL